MFFYANSKWLGFSGIRRLLSETSYDVLYLNSYWSTKITLLPLLNRWLELTPHRPVILAPRGEFSIEALKLKRVRKHIFISLSMVFGFYRDILWQASSDKEASDIKKALHSLAGNCCVAPDLILAPNPTVDPYKNKYWVREPSGAQLKKDLMLPHGQIALLENWLLKH